MNTWTRRGDTRLRTLARALPIVHPYASRGSHLSCVYRPAAPPKLERRHGRREAAAGLGSGELERQN
jgi:hypothetical protein